MPFHMSGSISVAKFLEVGFLGQSIDLHVILIGILKIYTVDR